MKHKLLYWILVFSLLVNYVSAYGIAPAKSDFEFNEEIQKGRFRVIVDEIPTKIVLTKEGELAEYIKLSKDVFVAEEFETWVDFEIRFSKELNSGERSGGIMALMIPKDTPKENIIVATTAVMHKVRVNVPYAGKYLIGKMYISNTEISEPTIFTIAVANYGKESVKNVKANIVIKGPTNEEIISLNTDEQSVDPTKETKILGIWQPDNPGTYVAEATVEYDGKILHLKQQFDIGKLEIEIEKIQVNNFKIGQIAKLDIYLRNKWNKPFQVGGKVEIFKNNKLVSAFNSVPIDINEKSTAVMESYWNTEGIEVGEYDITVKASYEGKLVEKTMSSIVNINDIQFKDLISGQVVKDKDNSKIALLIALVFILIISNIFLFIYISKKIKLN